MHQWIWDNEWHVLTISAFSRMFTATFFPRLPQRGSCPSHRCLWEATPRTWSSPQLSSSVRQARFSQVRLGCWLGICLPCLQRWAQCKLGSFPVLVCPQVHTGLLLLFLNFWASCSISTPWIFILFHFLLHKWSSEHILFSDTFELLLPKALLSQKYFLESLPKEPPQEYKCFFVGALITLYTCNWPLETEQ